MLGVILIDVDRLGQFTEMLGHQAGDEVLRAVAAALRKATREADMLGRYGRERFCLVVPHAMPDTIQDAAAAAPRARSRRTRSTSATSDSGA